MLITIISIYITIGFLITLLAVYNLRDKDFLNLFKGDLSNDDILEYMKIKEWWDEGILHKTLIVISLITLSPIFAIFTTFEGIFSNKNKRV